MLACYLITVPKTTLGCTCGDIDVVSSTYLWMYSSLCLIYRGFACCWRSAATFSINSAINWLTKFIMLVSDLGLFYRFSHLWFFTIFKLFRVFGVPALYGKMLWCTNCALWKRCAWFLAFVVWVTLSDNCCFLLQFDFYAQMQQYVMSYSDL